jgi:hypothetical protein
MTAKKIVKLPPKKPRGKFWGAGASKGYGLLAAPMVKPRPFGPGQTPAVSGLFRRGPAIAISQINAMATNVLQGSGG